MLSDAQMNLLRKIATRLRELKPYLDRTSSEINAERQRLPSRLDRSVVDEEMIETIVALDFASIAINDAINHIAEVTGEDETVAA